MIDKNKRLIVLSNAPFNDKSSPDRDWFLNLSTYYYDTQWSLSPEELEAEIKEFKKTNLSRAFQGTCSVHHGQAKNKKDQPPYNRLYGISSAHTIVDAKKQVFSGYQPSAEILNNPSTLAERIKACTALNAKDEKQFPLNFISVDFIGINDIKSGKEPAGKTLVNSIVKVNQELIKAEE
ncbi:MAG TPA: hypothetical protein QGF02_01300 [Candidatus Babeliales bacterium]|nr:hypothetical protein [Candidatus Babeliales bacterium]